MLSSYPSRTVLVFQSIALFGVFAMSNPLWSQTDSASRKEETPRPNILFFFVDDMGWQDTSVPFHTETTKLNRIYKTPNMERLAARGMKFRQAYACAVCSPSRISLMTGMNSARHGVTNWTLHKNKQPDRPNPFVRAANWNLNGLSSTPGIERTVCATTLPSILKQAGYRTIHCGKAHFGAVGTPGEDPCNLGFDVNIAGHAAGGPGSYYGTNNFSAAFRNGSLVWDVPGLEKYHGEDIYLTEALTREAINAVEQSVADQVPFYLYMSHYAIHAPWEKDDRFHDKYTQAGIKGMQATYASMIEGMDKSLGDLMDCLEKNGVAENTVIVFMSDNGQPSQAPRNLPLRGHKLTPYEGGTRVPLIVNWPGVTPAQSVCDDMYVMIEDFFPTFLDIAGVDYQSESNTIIDGKSFSPRLNPERFKQKEGKIWADQMAHRPIYWHFPNTYNQPPYSSIRQGSWKLIYQHIPRRLELYNLEDDLGETKNLAVTNSSKTRELAMQLGRHLRETKAAMTLDRMTGEPIEYPDVIANAMSRYPKGVQLPESAIAANLLWKGTALSDPNFTFWGAAPVLDEQGRAHLFVARWPETNVDPAWRKSSEIAHYMADSPEGSFEFQQVVVKGTGQKGDWDAYAPHNPEIKKFGDTYALLYIANTDYHQPPHPHNQTIGMMVSKSLDGPWKKVGANGQILSGSKDSKHWTHGKLVANPTIIQYRDQFLLYFKTNQRGKKGTVYAVAVADKLTGPYRLPDRPLTSGDRTIEDGTVFVWKDYVCLLTTDNHGQNTGIAGGGVLWVSSDGLQFNPAWTQVGYDLIPRYFSEFAPGKTRKIYGPHPKLERPKVLMTDGKPAYLFAPSGWAVHGGERTATYVLKINLTDEDSPIPNR